MFEAFPYVLLELVSPCATETARKAVADKLFAAGECCVDHGVSKKVRKIPRTPADLLKHKKVKLALRMWAKRGRIGNMGLEQLIAAIRRNTPKSANVESLISAGLLCQVQRRHLESGGVDIRKGPGSSASTRTPLLERAAAALQRGDVEKAKSAKPIIAIGQISLSLRSG